MTRLALLALILAAALAAWRIRRDAAVWREATSDQWVTEPETRQRPADPAVWSPPLYSKRRAIVRGLRSTGGIESDEAAILFDRVLWDQGWLIWRRLSTTWLFDSPIDNASREPVVAPVSARGTDTSVQATGSRPHTVYVADPDLLLGEAFVNESPTYVRDVSADELPQGPVGEYRETGRL